MTAEPCRLVVLWAQMSEESPSRIWPQFVAAFTDGEMECWPEMFANRREEAERWYANLTAPTEVERFFLTRADLARPDFPTEDDGWDVVYPCAACGFDHACTTRGGKDGCHT